DTIKIQPRGSTGSFEIRVNQSLVGVFSADARPVIHGLAGDDDIQVSGPVSVPLWLYGDEGRDRIRGRDGADVILGAAGDDLLVGGGGRDLLIGGRGSDQIVGNADDDILIAGTTTYDAQDLALAAILDEWSSGRSYAIRVANLKGTGTGPQANGTVFLTF